MTLTVSATPTALTQNVSPWHCPAISALRSRRASFLRHNPNITEAHRVGVLLQHDRALGLNPHPVMQHGDAGVGRLLAGSVKLGCGEIDIVSLPRKGRKADVQFRP